MKVSHHLWGIALATAALLGSCSQKEEDVNIPTPNTTTPSYAATQQYVDNEVIVKFRGDVPLKSSTNIMQQLGAVAIDTVVRPSALKANEQDGVYLYSVKGSVPSIVAQLRGMPEVAYAEPNYIYTKQVLANDPYFTNGTLWGMCGEATSPVNQYGSHAADAWANGHTGASTVWVGVIDEGYMYAHADLAANAGKNPGEIAGNKKDDDGNGYKDDVYGWNFYSNNSTVFGGTADDHGTHVSGTIGAAGGNAAGVAGVCWNVRIINCKFLGFFGGTTANAVKAVSYLTDLKSRSKINLVAINNSWGGGGYSQALKDAIDKAGNAGILFVVAAGNGGSDGRGDNNDATPTYPASYTSSNIITVASISSSGALSSFSNYGATSVHVGAPGESIYSTIPLSSTRSGYGYMSGTSMATPHVTGACALYASTHPGASAADIKAAIISTAKPTPSLAGKCVANGRLDVSGF